MGADLQATSVAVEPATALQGGTEHNRLAADWDGAADGRVLRPDRSRRSGYREPVRNHLRYLADVVVSDVEEHHTRLSARNLVGVALFVHGSRQCEELHLAGNVFVLDVEHAVVAAYLIAACRVYHLDGLDNRGQAPGVSDLQRIRKMDQSIGAFHWINAAADHV